MAEEHDLVMRGSSYLTQGVNLNPNADLYPTGAAMEDWSDRFLFSCVLLFVGSAILYGTWRGVKFLIDPPPDMWYAGSNRTLKKLIGTKGMRIYYYLIGGLLFAFGLAGLATHLVRLLP